jgi:Zn-dependent protease
VFDLSFHQFLIRAAACLLIVAIHGLALAAIARVMGDRGPQLDDRLTASPFRHLDPIGAVTMILAQIGWVRPIAIDAAQLRFGRPTLIVCVLGSIAATLAAVILLLQLRVPALVFLPSVAVPTVIATLNETAEMCTWFAAFNLMPVPPLTGMHLVAAVRPDLVPFLITCRIYAALALAALVLAGIVQPILQPGRNAIAGLLLGS